MTKNLKPGSQEDLENLEGDMEGDPEADPEAVSAELEDLKLEDLKLEELVVGSHCY